MDIKRYAFTHSEEKLIERIVDDKNTAIIHVVLPEGEALPPHTVNPDIYLIMLRGAADITLNGTKEQYTAGSILAIPAGTQMELKNGGPGNYEIFIVKTGIK